MALKYENFESYAVGATAIAGWWNWFGQGSVVAGGPDGSTRAFRIGAPGYLGTVIAAPVSSVSVWWSQGLTNGGGFYAPLVILVGGNLANLGPDLGGTQLFTLQVESDQTLSARIPGNVAIGFSAGPIDPGRSFIQVNATFSSVAGFLHVDVSVAVDGVTVITGSGTSSLTVASLSGGLAQCDTFDFSGANDFGSSQLDEITIDTLTAIGSYPNPGVPLTRVTQGVIESITLPDEAQVIISQGVIELILGAQPWRVYEA